MMKTIPTLLTILISSLAIFTIEVVQSSDHGFRPNWLADSHHQRVELFKKWLGNKPAANSIGNPSPSASYGMLDPAHQFKGKINLHFNEKNRFFFSWL